MKIVTMYGKIADNLDLENVLGSCPEYLEKGFSKELGYYGLLNKNPDDRYVIGINRMDSPANTMITVMAKDEARANYIAQKVKSKIGMEEVELPQKDQDFIKSLTGGLQQMSK